MYKLIFLFAVLVVKGGHADTSLGSCTEVEPLAGFEMNKFLGFWHVIQKTGVAFSCLAVNITIDGENEGQYKVSEIYQHTPFLSSLHHEHQITGSLTVPKTSTPGKMILHFPLDAGSTEVTVFMTDYDNYAGVFTCAKMPLIHHSSAFILARTPSPNMDFVDKVRTRLSSYNIDPFTLSLVSQADCYKPGAQGELLHAASNVITNVGGKINSLVS